MDCFVVSLLAMTSAVIASVARQSKQFIKVETSYVVGIKLALHGLLRRFTPRNDGAVIQAI